MAAAREMGQGHGALSRAAALVREAKADFDALDRRLVGHLATAESVWVGHGSAAFQALGQAWAEKQRVIVGALDQLEESLRSTERDNTVTDEQQLAAFARTQRRLG